jgi:hypothetical protein
MEKKNIIEDLEIRIGLIQLLELSPHLSLRECGFCVRFEGMKGARNFMQ